MEAFEALYDSHLACNVFIAWKESTDPHEQRELLNELLLQLAPLVQVVSIAEVNPVVGEANFEIIRFEAFEYLFFVLIEEYIPIDIGRGTGTFTGYFWTVIKRGLSRGFKRTYHPSVFDFGFICRETPPIGRLLSHHDAEIKMYLSQFHHLVMDAASNDIRFSGKEKKACLYIGKCLLGILDYHPLSARYRYKIPKPRALYLVQYMEHILKMAAKEVKQIDEAVGVTK